jgi:hypothetical protein
VRSAFRVHRIRALAVAAVVAGAACASSVAAAPSADEATLDALSTDRTHAAVVQVPVAKAREALARAKSMDAAGDAPHARLARALAHEWTRTAEDLVRAAVLEDKAMAAERSLDDLATKTVRSRALLEETAARRGRALAALEQLEKEPPPPPPTAKAPGKKTVQPGTATTPPKPVPKAPEPKP